MDSRIDGLEHTDGGLIQDGEDLSQVQGIQQQEARNDIDARPVAAVSNNQNSGSAFTFGEDAFSSSVYPGSARLNSFNASANPKFVLLDPQADLSGLQHLEDSDYDKASTQQIGILYDQITKINREIGILEAKLKFAEEGYNALRRIQPTLEQHAAGLYTQQENIEELRQQLVDLEGALQSYANAARVKHVNLKRDIQCHEKALLAAVEAHAEALVSKTTAQGLAAETNAQVAVDAQQGIIFDSARAILRLRVQENRGLEPSPLLEKKIVHLQMQLRETAREQRAANPASTWSLTNPWVTEQGVQKALNSRALRSVEKLANNPAFTNLKNIKNAGDLKINEKLLDLMNISLFALLYFNKASANNSAANFSSQQDTSIDTIAGSSELFSTPMHALNRANSASMSASQSPARGETNTDNADIVNQAVIDVMRHDLAEIQKEAGGLIGSPNPNRQFWGKVLMVLALAIATTVSAVFIMSMLGVASPAFLVPYLAAIQASSMVSTVLNFVAAKLAVDLNTAAVVTAAATAGTFGLFGKVADASGAPTSLKRDLDRAAQDMEAALKETPAARSTMYTR